MEDKYVEVKFLGTERDLEEIIRLCSIINRLGFEKIDKSITINLQGSKESVFCMVNGKILQVKKEYLDKIGTEPITLGT
jgi:hypothetical protein